MLRHIEQAPPLICLKGRADLFAMPAVAVVGTRSASALGRKFARELSVALGKSGLLVVSGLARGIDTVAHEASIETGTVAVLAGGIDVVYPPENETLYHEIAERGVLVTEMTPGTVPRAESFPRRNRLISGISLGVLFGLGWLYGLVFVAVWLAAAALMRISSVAALTASNAAAGALPGALANGPCPCRPRHRHLHHPPRQYFPAGARRGIADRLRQETGAVTWPV